LKPVIPLTTQGAEDDTAYDCADNAKEEVEKEAQPGRIYDLAGDEPGRVASSIVIAT